ncbi:MAG: SIR2 family protein, partial [Deltaproteobacteria bacterium]|nr:SIR2 family protein [Deltaproteobacteria bacterium]
MIDPAVALAMSVQSNPGAYAALLGSGVSQTSGIPTGWGIVCDLVTRVARMHGEPAGEDPAAWYEARYGKQPDYSELLAEVARSPTERARLLRSYFEPTEEERARGAKAPTPSHRALARLAKGGFIRVFVTTNFDRLLEQALADENIVPSVIATCSDLQGAPPLGAGQVTLVKVHGDYVDCRIKNTPEELAQYEPPLDALLDRIIGDHGFIVAGWSAQWDKALVEAFLRADTPRYATWWTGRRPPKGPGAKLLAARHGEFVPVEGADEFFAQLTERVAGASVGQCRLPERQIGLPSQLSSFVGREDDIAAIHALLDANRLVTLHALGGGGKTRTAIEVARSRLARHADGASFVDLAAVDDPERVPETIAHGLGYGLEKLHTALRGRELLVVLDNCEHVAAAVARFVPRVLSEAPRVKVLVTSRVPLGVPGEVVSALEPMAVPPYTNLGPTAAAQFESVQLFSERAREVNPRWRLTDDEAPHVARICRSLDGHPLAIELAAARVKLLPARQIADRLEQGMELLKAGSRDLRPDRQKTLAAAWAWSLEALAEPARLLFERLSVFRGGF